MSFANSNIRLMVMMVITAIATYLLHPSELTARSKPFVDYEKIVPASFGVWTEIRVNSARIIDPQQQETIDKLYSQTVNRTYIGPGGYQIMLSMAYGETQRGKMQLHHPEVCYPAQGFAVKSNITTTVPTNVGNVPVRRLETAFENTRIEPVTYWALVGDEIALGSVSRKLIEMRHGFNGQIADGLLFRISSIDRDSANAFKLQEQFITDLISSVPPESVRLLTGL